MGHKQTDTHWCLVHLPTFEYNTLNQRVLSVKIECFVYVHTDDLNNSYSGISCPTEMSFPKARGANAMFTLEQPLLTCFFFPDPTNFFTMSPSRLFSLFWRFENPTDVWWLLLLCLHLVLYLPSHWVNAANLSLEANKLCPGHMVLRAMFYSTKPR